MWPSERRNELLGSMKPDKGYSAIAAPFAHLNDINVNIGAWKYFHFLFWEVEKGYFRHRNKGRGIHVNTYNRAISLSPHLFSRHFPV